MRDLEATCGAGNPRVVRSMILEELYRLEQAQVVEVALPCRDKTLSTIYDAIHTLEGVCSERPGLWNVVAYEREWDQYASYFDFLDTQSPNYALKRFQCMLYMEHIRPFLDTKVPHGACVLDAGGGVGRFSDELIGRGYTIYLVDTSEKALKCAVRHFEEKGYTAYRLLLADAAQLEDIPDNYFQATFAIELICYCTEPARVVQELRRVTAPGGVMFFSVEGKYGSLLADTKVQCEHFETIMDEGALLRKQDVFVRYFTDEELKALLEQCGLTVMQLSGTHYVPDGILHRFVNERGLGDQAAEQEIMAIERRCSTDPVLRPLARAWIAVCTKE